MGTDTKTALSIGTDNLQSSGYAPDFNSAVKSFDVNKSVFNQQSYDARVRAEAEVMVAIENMRNELK